MTEKEKMLAHQWYDANFDSELINDRKKLMIYALTITIQSQAMKTKEMKY